MLNERSACADGDLESATDERSRENAIHLKGRVVLMALDRKDYSDLTGEKVWR
jgi:hypothetical protein